MENKLSAKEKEIESQTEKSQSEKVLAKRDLYIQTLEVMASKDKGFSGLLNKLKIGMQSVILS